jgi:hypothetical protein
MILSRGDPTERSRDTRWFVIIPADMRIAQRDTGVLQRRENGWLPLQLEITMPF